MINLWLLSHKLQSLKTFKSLKMLWTMFIEHNKWRIYVTITRRSSSEFYKENNQAEILIIRTQTFLNNKSFCLISPSEMKIQSSSPKFFKAISRLQISLIVGEDKLYLQLYLNYFFSYLKSLSRTKFLIQGSPAGSPSLVDLGWVTKGVAFEDLPWTVQGWTSGSFIS